MIDPAYRNINSLFVLLFKLGINMAPRHTFNRHYLPLIKIKDFNALIDNKPFFNQSINNKQEAYEKLVEMSRTIIIQQETTLFILFITLFVPSKIL